MLTMEYYGMPLTWQRITPGNTATSISEYMYRYTEHTIVFTDGNNAAIPAIGSIITGNNSGARAIVVTTPSLTGASSWAANNAAGSMRIKSYGGTFDSNEKIDINNVFSCNMTGSPRYYSGGYKYKGMKAKAILIQAETYAQRIMFDGHGANPDQDADLGIYLSANASIVITDPSGYKNIKTIDATGGQAGSLNVVGYF